MTMHIASDTKAAARIINSQLQYYYIMINISGLQEASAGNEQGGLVC